MLKEQLDALVLQLAAVSSAYTWAVTEDAVILAPHDGQSFAIRFRDGADTGLWDVSQSFAPRHNLKPVWYSKRHRQTTEQAVAWLISDWNRSCKIDGLGRTPI